MGNMSIRHMNKQNRRLQQRVRRMLVHAAGCVESQCISKTYIYDLGEDTPIIQVKVPRSLRSKLGLTIGGHN